MKDDSVISHVRKSREEISTRFGGDMAKIYAYFKEEEKKLGKKVSLSRKQIKKSTPIQPC